MAPRSSRRPIKAAVRGEQTTRPGGRLPAARSDGCSNDPTLNVKVKTKSKRKGGYPPWTDDDMAKFEARWPRGTRERVIFDILT
jgi:hypothetical protein